jgi:hypothetical protein
MKFKSTILAQASGALAGLVASHNRGGMYLRSRSIPTNPGSDPQNDLRASFGAFASNWKSLTQDQRNGWKAYADAVSFTDRLGDPRHLTGLDMYIRANVPRNVYFPTPAAINNAPTDMNIGATPIFNSIVATYEDSTKIKATCTMNIPDAPVAANYHNLIFFFASNPQNQSKEYYKGPFIHIESFGIEALASQPQICILYIPGNWNVAGGEKVFIRATVSREDGRYSGASIGMDITGPHP